MSAAVPKVHVEKNGDLLVTGLPDPLLKVIREVPEILEEASNRADARERLFPNAYDGDEAANAHWLKHAQPEIAALFASARELVAGDLEKATFDGAARRTWRIPIPASHHTAWMAALNGARLAIGVFHDVTAEDLDRLREGVPATARDFAVLRIHYLGWVEELLVSAASSGG